MHIVRDNTTGLLFSPFAVGGVWALQVAVLHYFDLRHPDDALDEQDMWRDTAPFTGETGLDAGFPKQRGEALVAGSWFAPEGVPAPGGSVNLEIGTRIRRRLLAFGPRYWQAGPAGPRPSEPEPVTTVAIRWENAFGGKNYPENPKGVGAEPLETAWGEKRRYLPQVEAIGSEQMTAPSQMPLPASFAPVLPGAPSRVPLAGTYDDAWKKQYWPGFPPDVHPDFFQMAQAGQRLAQGFFEGGESILLEGMHPAYARIESRLPTKRVRVFFTRYADVARPDTYLFSEATARAETVWFFPECLRGILLYRAVFPCADDEASDIRHLFPVVEDASADMTDIEYWHTEFKRRIAAPAPPDPAPLAAAKATVEAVKLRTRTLEEDLHFALDRGLGQAPLIPAPASQRIQAARKTVNRTLSQIDTAKKQMQSARKQYSNLVKINPAALDATRMRFSAMLPRLDKMEKTLGTLATANPLTMVQEKISENASAMLAEVKKVFPAALAQARVAPPPPLKELMSLSQLEEASRPVRMTWNQQALTRLAHGQVVDAEDAVSNPLCQAGIRRQDLFRCGVAYAPTDWVLNHADWHLPPEGGSTNVAAGYLIPWFQGNECVRLAVRNVAPEWQNDAARQGLSLFLPCQQEILPGSTEGIQLLGGWQEGRPILLTLDPLMGWLLYAQVGDLYAILIATSPAAPPPETVASLLASAAFVLLPVSPSLLPSAMPAAARQQQTEDILKDWRKLAEKAEVIVWEDRFSAPNLAYARHQGLDIRDWLMKECIRRGLPQPENEASLQAEFDEKGALRMELSVPKPDAKGIYQRLNARVQAFAEGKKQEVQKAVEKSLQKYGEIQARHPDVLKPLPPIMGQPSPATLPSLPEASLSAFDPLIALNQRKNPVGSAATQLVNAKREVVSQYNNAHQLYADSVAKLDAFKKSVAQGGLRANPPEWAKSIPGASAILNPKKMTPESVLADLQSGQLSNTTLNDLDLSGKDLRNCRFEKMIMNKVRFTGANLQGCVFADVIGTEIDFQSALMDGVSMNKCSWEKVDWSRAHCAGMKLELCGMRSAVVADTLLQGAHFRLVQAEGSWQGTIRGLRAELTDLNGKWRDALLSDCQFENCSVSQSQIEGLTVQRGSMHSVGFVMCQGSDLRFDEVSARNMRMVQSTFDHVTFAQCDLSSASFRESTLNHAAFTDCRMDSACVESCQMPLAVLQDCRAPGTVIRHSNLEGADMRGSSLPGGSLRRTRLVNADLREANLYGAELYKAVLGNTRLDAANLKRTLIDSAEHILRQEGMTPKT
ncbi:MAG: DUF2169 domain-containing protein [Burkholderiaceae bacterium]|jgi:uncharacterized protein YjbI with pentapeptide repeats|nr:DUF2169 domain-containing protein [Burkholderiaceae bacterium]